MKPPNSYVVCTSPRSGSTLLCRLLRDTGIAGYPESHFHAPSLEKWLGYYADLSAAPYATLGRVLTALGLKFESKGEVTPPVAKLADATNRDWAERFQSEEQS